MLHLNQPVFSVPRIRGDVVGRFFDRELIAVVIGKGRDIPRDRIRLSQPVPRRRIRQQPRSACRHMIGQQIVPAVSTQQIPLIDDQTALYRRLAPGSQDRSTRDQLARL